MKKEIKVEWCENFIKSHFGPRHHAFAGSPDAGIEANCFFRMAEEAGLYERGTYGSPMSKALSNLCDVEMVFNDGEFAYDVFRLKK